MLGQTPLTSDEQAFYRHWTMKLARWRHVFPLRVVNVNCNITYANNYVIISHIHKQVHVHYDTMIRSHYLVRLIFHDKIVYCNNARLIHTLLETSMLSGRIIKEKRICVFGNLYFLVTNVLGHQNTSCHTPSLKWCYLIVELEQRCYVLVTGNWIYNTTYAYTRALYKNR